MRRQAYACDITYASNKEIAFDYLRDRIALGDQPSNIATKLRRVQGDADAGVVMRADYGRYLRIGVSHKRPLNQRL